MKDKGINDIGFDPKRLNESAKEMINQMNKATSFLKERMHGVVETQEFENVISKNDIEEKINTLNYELKSLRDKLNKL